MSESVALEIPDELVAPARDSGSGEAVIALDSAPWPERDAMLVPSAPSQKWNPTSAVVHPWTGMDDTSLPTL
jgi:hypothetical protein